MVLLLKGDRGRKPRSKREVSLLGSRGYNKSVVDGRTRLCQFDVVINHTMRQGFLLSCVSEIGCLPNTNNIFLLKVGLSVSILDMAWMFSPPFTTHTASLNKSGLIVLPFPTVFTLLCPQRLQGPAPCFPPLDFAEYFLAIILLW